MASLVLTTACIHVLLALFASCVFANNLCGKYECPEYTVIKRTDEFEVRRYPSYRYAIAREKDVSMYKAGNRNFMKLFGYIEGKNVNKTHIPMTVPVICPLTKDSTGNYVEDFSMMFWLPEKYQCLNCPPKPEKADKLKDQVMITMWGERIAYVRSYGWWAFEWLIKHNEGKLRASLDAAKIVAGVDYDSTLSILRHTTNRGKYLGGTTKLCSCRCNIE